ncbi:hypothetical protein PTSG_09525 [Salpingoeca rosetta]|uniref:Peptidase S9A N-terminal domain-containing protein n=1 Tax=Salpingoeca rosetta (strain ATCC 50818 / BSB-021) TaxID=946362 RepID=F2UL92_SALR5|nr:uncharacterized protein PTSG_09525 [Salpingoeca rosetta]EGD77891.1 hypothetical protein PTSG_09525 [Salpingoeca rosetta]|eukprot:XP_004989955.1 hypothetical protein PTSG_09525 [Salpingoeca rosetta]
MRQHAGDSFYVVTDADGADNYKVCRAPANNPTKPNWIDVLPSSDEVIIEDGEMFHNHLILFQRSKQGDPFIRVLALDTNTTHDIQLPEDERVGVITSLANPNFDDTRVRFSVSTPLQPRIEYTYDLASRRLWEEYREQLDATTAFDPSLFVCERLWAPSREDANVFIPMTVGEDPL